jgi:hypothetical protein
MRLRKLRTRVSPLFLEAEKQDFRRKSNLGSGRLKLAASVMSDWLKKKDPKTGHWYYINKETREATWAKPQNARIEDAATGETSDVEKPPDDDGEGADEWLELKDPKTGRPYFMHPVSRRTSWIKPQPGAGAGAGGDDDDEDSEEAKDKWLELKDPETGHAYYMHGKTRRTSWVKPDADGNQEGNWMKLKDPKTGQDYYMHPVTRRTSWVDPARQTPGDPTKQATGEAASKTSVGGASSLWGKTMAMAESDDAKGSKKVSLDVSSDAPQRENTPAHPVTPHPGPQPKKPGAEGSNDKWVELKDPKVILLVVFTSFHFQTSDRAHSDMPPFSLFVCAWFIWFCVQTGRYYYMHPQSRRTSWIKPGEINDVKITEDGQVELKSAGGDGWLELKDPSTGHP